MINADINFVRANENDAQDIINERNLAFYSDYIRYGECPGYNIPMEIMKKIISKSSVFKIMSDDKIIGDFSARSLSDKAYFIGCLSIVPEYQNKGVGKKAIKYMSVLFPDAEKWTLITPADNKRNLYFYKKCGFAIVGRKMDGNVKVVIFEKTVNKLSN